MSAASTSERSYRRTLVGSKLVALADLLDAAVVTDEPLWGRSCPARTTVVSEPGLQTNPCGVEASFSMGVAGCGPRLQTNPCGVEAPAGYYSDLFTQMLQTNPCGVEASTASTRHR